MRMQRELLFVIQKKHEKFGHGLWKNLSKKTGISEMQLRRIKRGESVPSLSNWLAIMDALEMEVYVTDKLNRV